MITSFKLKFGRLPGASPVHISGNALTIFVGPNNSGKSRVLREIKQYCSTGRRDSGALILDELTFLGTDARDAAEELVKHVLVKASPNSALVNRTVHISSPDRMLAISEDALVRSIQNPSQNPDIFCKWFLNYRTLMLDGRNRISLVSPQEGGDLKAHPKTSLQVLFRDDAKRTEVRRIVAEAFGTYFIVDPTHLGNLRIGLAPRPPIDVSEERGLHAAAIAYHQSAQPIENASDGVKAFTGIISAIVAGDPEIVLIDEPEAFLHPSLAAKLGLEVARAANSANKRVFVSTHSPMFLMGCIQSGAPVDIVRLTYRNNSATARVLPSTEILELMRNPLLRSTGVLTGLFYECVVVTESDTDRAFYQEINERLLRFQPEWGIPNCLFLNAQNKQTVHTIIKPLRKLGIPAAAIVDIDMIKEGGGVWTSLLAGGNVPLLHHQPLGSLRSAILGAIDATGRDMKRDGGTLVLTGQEKEAAENLLHQLREYGIFLVPIGELESWLRGLNVSGHGANWLVNIFQQMGEDPDAPSYVRPSHDDVWHFMSLVRAWLIDPERKGIPA